MKNLFGIAVSAAVAFGATNAANAVISFQYDPDGPGPLPEAQAGAAITGTRHTFEIKQLHQGNKDLKTYDSADGVARRLMKTNPRLSEDKAQWLAQHWARPNAQGLWEILGDPAHKITSAQLYRVDEALAIYERITAPVLAIEASGDSLGQWWNGRYTLDEYHQRLTHVRNCRTAVVADAGHMLHHDQPEQVAQLMEQFLNEA